MERFVKKFWTEDSGNATVDWLVLTAGILLLGAAAMASIGVQSQAYNDRATTPTIEMPISSGV